MLNKKIFSDQLSNINSTSNNSTLEIARKQTKNGQTLPSAIVAQTNKSQAPPSSKIMQTSKSNSNGNKEQAPPSNGTILVSAMAKLENKEEARSEEEQKYMAIMKKEYGFDDETINIMMDVKDSINAKSDNQEYNDWLYTRTMGGLQYKGFKWESTAGNPYTQAREFEIPTNSPYMPYTSNGKLKLTYKHTEEDFFTDYLGIDEEDYDRLRYMVQAQYRISGGSNSRDNEKELMEIGLGRKLSDKEYAEKWKELNNSMGGKTDFAHENISTATILNPSILSLADIYTFGATHEMASWLGDATIGGANSSFGNDDYMADLNATSIAHSMEENDITYQEALVDYHSGLGTDYTRADKFLEHTPLERVKATIYGELNLFKDLLHPNFLKALEKKDYATKKMEEMKTASPAGYNFIRSLEDKKNTMGDYINK